MKTTVILLSLLAVIAMPANGQDFQQRVMEAIKKCVSTLNAEEATVKTLLSGKNFVDKKVACLACCAMETVGAMKNGKIDIEETVDDIIQSHRFDNHNAQVFRNIVGTCKGTAEKSNNKCSVAGEFLYCFKGFM